MRSAVGAANYHRCGMAFRDFGFPEVQQALGLSLSETNLFGDIPALDLPGEFVRVWSRCCAVYAAISFGISAPEAGVGKSLDVGGFSMCR
jgi:hypothetical protein